MDPALLLDSIDKLLTVDSVLLSDAELESDVLALDAARSKLDAAIAGRLAQAKRRQVAGQLGYRSEATWLSHQTHQPRPQMASLVSFSTRLVDLLPDVLAALADGRIRRVHADAIVRLAKRSELRDNVVRDQELFLRWAVAEPWPVFACFLAAWAEYHDPTDPRDVDEKAFNDRHLRSAQGLGGVTLAELSTPNLCWEQALEALTPIQDKLLESDWAEARARVGDDAVWTDLLRTDDQRRHDALIIGLRMIKRSDDPGAGIVANIAVDYETVLDEAERQYVEELLDGRLFGEASDHDDAKNVDDDVNDSTLTEQQRLAELDARIRRYRCETRRGFQITPSTALLCVLAGQIRRVTFSAKSLHFEASEKTRLYTGLKRHTLLLRDRHCQGAGCDVPSHRCEVDHQKRHTDGGLTTDLNGVSLCPACHRHKTRLEVLGLSPP